MKRNLTCIICPRGCALTAEPCDGALNVTGNGCPKGVDYAIHECLHPMRTVTISLRVANRENTMVSVKTESPVPKDKMMETAAVLRTLAVKAPIAVGEVLSENIFGSRVVATMSVL